MERTERTIEEYVTTLNSTYFQWQCPECKKTISMYHLHDKQTCACGYQWQVEVRPRFYVVRD